MRRLILLLAALVGLALGTAGVALLRSDPPADLLPNLDQAAPAALSVVRADGRDRLTFSSAVDTVGLGPLLVDGRRPSTATPAMDVRQRVQRTDGSERYVEVAGEMRFVESETHAHWHLLDFERYELRSADGEKLLAPDQKTGFCLGDRYETDARSRLENEPERAVWTQECGRGGKALLFIAAGISPGYGDDYVPELEGQYFDVTDLPSGRYLLVHRANPGRVLRESDYGDNAASVLLRLLRETSGSPTVRVIASCPQTDRCG